jgi:hypothetical protein
MAFRKMTLDRVPSSEEVLSINKSGIYFSAEFIKKNKLTEKQSISFYLDDEDPYKLGFEFYDNSGEQNSVVLLNSGRGRYTSNGRFVKAGELLSKNNLLKAIQKEQHKESRLFQIKKSRNDNIYFIELRPTFEISHQFNNKALIDDDLMGIYRYRNQENKIIYIGKGFIKSRSNAPERKEWGIVTIEYSILKNEEEAFKWENHHLVSYQNEFGTLPLFNRILGQSKE